MRPILIRATSTRDSGSRLTAIAAGPSSTSPYREENRTSLTLRLEDESGNQVEMNLSSLEISALARVVDTADASNESVGETAARLLENHRGTLSDTLIAELNAAL